MPSMLDRFVRSRPADALRQRVAGTPAHAALKRGHRGLAYVAWRARPDGPPPALHKIAELRRHARRHGLRVLVETGTFEGDTTAALARSMDRVVSIELSPELHAAAVARFAGTPHVQVVRGDSASVLPGVLDDLEVPALFWLDAHWSEGRTARGEEDSPVAHELRLVLGHAVEGHVVLVDDARAFVGSGGYPTIDEIRRLVAESGRSCTVEVRDDIIRICPAG